MSSKGFTLIEITIASFVIGVVVIGAFSLVTLTIKASHEGQRRIIATALGNEKMEMIRNLPYATVGTVGGIPSGPILSTEQITRNGSTYTVATDIRYVDDPYDGTATSNPPDLLNADYKQARVDVSWSGSASSRPILLITQIAPQGLEGGTQMGTLVFQALNVAGAGVAGATAHLVNTAVNPPVDLTTSTDDEGKIVIPGLPPASGTYELAVSKNGYRDPRNPLERR
jgi:prepilin-type N-terminal cleavage/methylation domain-containing protein